jgi:hypothetical protein
MNRPPRFPAFCFLDIVYDIMQSSSMFALLSWEKIEVWFDYYRYFGL